MTLPVSGTISLQDIQTEFGGANPISLNEYYKGGTYVLSTDYAPNVPTSGPISLNNFYGAKKTTLNTLTFSSSQTWTVPSTLVGTVTVLVGGGGGSGGCFQGGGPGAFCVSGPISLTGGSTVDIQVGSGGVFPTVGTTVDGGGTRVYAIEGVAGVGGQTSSFGSYVVCTGGAGGSNQGNVAAISGSVTASPSGSTSYTNTASVSSRRGANGLGQNAQGTYNGGNGVTISFGGTNYSVGGGGSGSNYWNVSGSTPGGRTPGGSGGGGISSLVAGNRSSGVQPPAGNPPVFRTDSFWPGGNGESGTGAGGGSASRCEVVFASGTYGIFGGNGGSGIVVVMGYW